MILQSTAYAFSLAHLIHVLAKNVNSFRYNASEIPARVKPSEKINAKFFFPPVVGLYCMAVKR